MIRFKDNFHLGVATASAQIEGGEPGSNWNHYSDAGKISDGSNIKRANQHWERYLEDIALLDELGIRHYRMSVEWARIEPEEGKFSEAAIQHYRDEIISLHECGIDVLLTLYHFSHPQWFEEKGAFTKEENIDIFLRFVAYTVDKLGDLVSDYCTLNEPNVYAVNSFFFGEWLNEEKSFSKTIQCMNVFIACHLEAYTLIHQIRSAHGCKDSMVTFAHHMRYFEAEKDNWLDRKGAKVLDFLFQTGLFEACSKARFRWPFRNLRHFESGQYIDKISINYYSRGLVHNFQDKTKEDAPKNDLGWEIYPEGLLHCARACYDYLPLPIIISENGTCDNQDDFRPLFLYDQLKLIAESDLPITHYYHWCFLDNFEWKEGERARFGLIHCDYESQKRTLKNSAKMYQEMIEAHGITKEIKKNYVDPCKYHHGERHVFPEIEGKVWR